MRPSSRPNLAPARATAKPANPMRWLGALAMLFALSAMILVLSATGEDRGPARVRALDSRPDTMDTAASQTAGRRLLGSAAADLESRFGPPAFIRNEGPSRLHRFADQHCTLFVFTFQVADTERVEHVESRAAQGATVIAIEDCIESLQRSRVRIAAVR